MATAPVPTDIKGNPRVLPTAITEVQDGERVTSLDVPLRGGLPEGAAALNREGDDSASLDLDLRTGLAPKPTEEAAEETPAATLEPQESDAETLEPPVVTSEGDLGEYKADDPEVVAKFEERFFTADNKVNLQALTTEFWSSAKEGKPGTLNEGTYAFLEARLGITKEAAKAIEKGLVADAQAENQKFLQRVGGRAKFQAALEWGRSNYTPEQVAAFNRAYQGADTFAKDNAVDALMARFGKANPGQAPGQRRGPPGAQRRGAAPQRSVASSASPGGGGAAAQVPYATQEAYTQAWNGVITAEKAATTPQARREAVAAREEMRDADN